MYMVVAKFLGFMRFRVVICYKATYGFSGRSGRLSDAVSQAVKVSSSEENV